MIATQIKEDEEYQGIRLRTEARLENARIPIQIDIGFGDAITPEPIEVEYPTYLDLPKPILLAYPRETVIAEKFQAMVMLGIANSRMKDFYDLWTLANLYDFNGKTLCQALEATFDRRHTELPTSAPLALTPEFYEDESKLTQWNAFLRKDRLEVEQSNFRDVAKFLIDFLMPPTEAAVAKQTFAKTWPPGGPWPDDSD
jgi:hypothetical protein